MSKYNLGIVKTSLLGNLNESIAIKQFLGLLKESNLLKLEYSIFDNIEKKHIANEDLAIKYIDENIKLLKNAGYTKENFEEENKKFLPLIEGLKLTNDNKELFEMIHVMLYESLNGKKTTNINKLHDAFTYVLEHLKNNTPKSIIESSSISLELDDIKINDFIVNKAIQSYNEKYNNLLSEEEKIVLSSIITEDISAKENAFNTIKNNTIKFLDDFIVEISLKESIDINEEREIKTYIERANHSKSSINEMKFNETTYMDDVITLIDFKN